MPNAFIGNLVQVPATALTNGGVDKYPGIIVEVGGTGPNGGILTNVNIFPNSSLTLISHITGVEFMDYESDARAIGVNAAAWPLDYAWA